MNYIFSLIRYIRENKNIKYKTCWTNVSYWDRYRFILDKNNNPIVCFKNENDRVGNFFYGYPNVNLQFTFFASKGLLGKTKNTSKLKWIYLFFKKVK